MQPVHSTASPYFKMNASGVYSHRALVLQVVAFSRRCYAGGASGAISHGSGTQSSGINCPQGLCTTLSPATSK